MENVNYFDDKMSDPQGRGYVMYRMYDDGVHVLMGSHTDFAHRGKGIFKTLFERFLENEVKLGEIVYIALINKKILPYLLGKGFVKIKEPIRHWGKVGNGVNLKYVKK